MNTDTSALSGSRIDAFEVTLDQDHPGLHDLLYRRRRDEIARLALDHVPGTAVPTVAYTAQEEATWKTVWSHLRSALEETACAAVWERMQAWAPWERGIPQLAELSEGHRLGSGPGSGPTALLGPLYGTGFRFEPVHGLLSSQDFFASLKRSVFRSTQYLRHGSRPLYTPEPDLVHELVGHASTFSIPGVPELSVAFGEAAASADEATLLRLERLYWYTVEFGLVRENGEPRAFGAGLLSSAGELARIPNVELRPFSDEAVQAQAYQTDRPQSVLFIAESLDQLLEETADAVMRLDAERKVSRA
ncbi:MAG: phenylalanine-4-hydroxylase [Planctomycetota bacterium]|jgi:phenylalanine-4-hydroxylase